MNISGLWKYEDERKKRISAELELAVVKATATQLTNENNDLKREFDEMYDDHTRALRANVKADIKLEKAEARIKELEAEVSQPKWGYHEMMTTDGIRVAGWIPIEGTAYQILSKTPAMFPQFCKEKRVPEK